ncbi:MAG: exodeoxyribonuclease VII large subunit, partial [Burkholderiaceae bacterium]
RVADRLEPALVQSVQTRSHRVQTVGARLVPALDRALAQKRLPYARAGANLRPSVLSRAIADAQQKLNALERMRQSLGYMATLKRGYAVLRSETGLITTTAALRTASEVEVELADGKAQVKPFL